MSDVSLFLPLYLAAWDKRFCWVDAHCGTFVGGWVRAVTGRDPSPRMPAVAGAGGWARAARAHGGMRGLVSHVVGCQPQPVAGAQAGDLLMFPGHVTGGALGIRLYAAGAAVLDEAGRVRVTAANAALCAWPLAGILSDEVPA